MCDHEMVSANPEWYTKDKNGDFQPPLGTDWSDVYDLDYTNLELRQYMIDAMEYWVKEYDIDGFRCDVAGMVPTDFWESAVERLNLIKPIKINKQILMFLLLLQRTQIKMLEKFYIVIFFFQLILLKNL